MNQCRHTSLRVRLLATSLATSLLALLQPGCTTTVTDTRGIGADQSYPDRSERSNTDESFKDWFTGGDDDDRRR